MSLVSLAIDRDVTIFEGAQSVWPIIFFIIAGEVGGGGGGGGGVV